MHAALLTACLFALTGLCANQSSRLLGGARANFWRLIIAVLLLAIWAHGFGGGFGGGVLAWFCLAGGIGFGLGGWCVFQALRRIGSTLTLLLVECAAAAFATAIAWIWLDAALRPVEILAVLAILSGIFVGTTPAPIPDLAARAITRGCALALAAGLFQAISFNLSRHAFLLMRELESGIGPLTAAYQRLLGGLCVAALLHALTRWLAPRISVRAPAPSPCSSPLPAPAWVLLNALFGPVLGVSCMLWAISLVENPGLVQAVAATATLLTVPLARRLEHARPGRNYYLGSLLALIGISLLLVLP